MSEAWSATEAVRCLSGHRPADTERMASARLAAVPDDAEAWFLLGAARHRLGDRAGALAAFETSIRLAPGDLRPRTARGALQAEAGRHAEALATFEEALALQPADPRLLVNAAVALEHLDRPDEALACYDRALAAFPGMGDALLNRTALLLRLQRPEAAHADAERLVRLFPGVPEAWFNRAEAALALGRPEAALADCERALEANPAYVRAWIDKGIALAVLGRLDEADAAFARARALDAGAAERLSRPPGPSLRDDGDILDARRFWLHALWRRQLTCDWRDHERAIARAGALIDATAGSPRALRDRAIAFSLMAWPVAATTRRALLADIAAEVRRNAAAEAPRYAAGPPPGRRLRIGYLSPGIRDHPSVHITLPLYGAHDRERFDVHVYSLVRHGGPEPAAVAARCEHYIDVSGRTDAEIASRVHADGIDILVDLAGYTEDARPEILAMRPAPVRVGMFGQPGSLGPGIVDYRVTDATTTPPAYADEFCEALLRLPETFWICDPDPPAGPRPARRDAGLPDTGFVFCSLNNAYKFEPRSFGLWMGLLRDVPGAVLWLLDGPPGSRERLQTAVSAHGIERSRLVFAPRVDRPAHFARLPLADLFLDTFTYNAHTTGCDTLVAGVPMLTCPGTAMASRIGASLVRAAGLPELVAADEQAYVDLALALARDRDRLLALRARLARRDAPLFDTVARVRALERGLAQAVARHRAGLPPVDIDVAPEGGA